MPLSEPCRSSRAPVDKEQIYIHSRLQAVDKNGAIGITFITSSASSLPVGVRLNLAFLPLVNLHTRFFSTRPPMALHAL